MKDSWTNRRAAQGLAVLTEEQIAEIQRRYKAGGISQRALGLEYGIGQVYVCRIVNRSESTQ